MSAAIKDGRDPFIGSLKKFKFYLAIALLSMAVYPPPSMALSIFEVRRRLAMTNGEVTEKDFYLNGGTEKGLKPGMIVTVMRQIGLYDAYQNKSPGELVIPVGEVKVLFVQKGVSVAREHALFDRKNLPILDENYLMVGDEVDLTSARPDKGIRAPTSETDKVSTREAQVSPVKEPKMAVNKVPAAAQPAEPAAPKDSEEAQLP
jgi:hypothetical protein